MEKVCRSHTTPLYKANLGLSLYVGKSALRQPQDSSRGQLQFMIALFSSARFGVV
jgi:hypothetical protein